MIEIDTTSLKNGAKNIEEAATILGRDGEVHLTQAADRLKAGWSGKAADTYIKFLQSAADLAYKYQSSLKQYSDAMRKIAAEIDKANAESRVK